MKMVDPRVVVTEPGTVLTLGAVNCAATTVGAAAMAAQATSRITRVDVMDAFRNEG
jgi:hypothetical protein